MMKDSNCIFCKIIAGKIPAEKIYEDSHSVAFLDLEPRAPGHTLVIPKEHSEFLSGLPDEEIGPLFLAVKNVSGAVIDAVHADGATIGINQGSAAGQVVGHIHVHIVPRFYKDGGGAIQSVVQNKPKESLKEIKDEILKKS